MQDQHVAPRMPWREKPFHTLKATGEIISASTPTLYKMEEEGILVFMRLRNRTVVKTDSIIAFVDNASAWSPSASPNPLAPGRDGAP